MATEEKLVAELRNELTAALAEVSRLQNIIDSRPAINAGLPDSYIAWSQSIYVMEAVGAMPRKVN